jgi:hypothetical protein
MLGGEPSPPSEEDVAVPGTAVRPLIVGNGAELPMMLVAGPPSIVVVLSPSSESSSSSSESTTTGVSVVELLQFVKEQ